MSSDSLEKRVSELEAELKRVNSRLSAIEIGNDSNVKRLGISKQVLRKTMRGPQARPSLRQLQHMRGETQKDVLKVIGLSETEYKIAKQQLTSALPTTKEGKEAVELMNKFEKNALQQSEYAKFKLMMQEYAKLRNSILRMQAKISRRNSIRGGKRRRTRRRR